MGRVSSVRQWKLVHKEGGEKGWAVVNIVRDDVVSKQKGIKKYMSGLRPFSKRTPSATGSALWGREHGKSIRGYEKS